MSLDGAFLIIIMKKTISIICSFWVITGACGYLEANNDAALVHIQEEITYPDSPFNELVRDAFKNNRHYINVLNIGDEALQVWVHLIRIAKRTINIQTFIWGNDTTARFVAGELLKAAARGVKINIIVDDLSDKKGLKSIRGLTPALRIKYYNPVEKDVYYGKLQLAGRLLTDFKRLNQRMHNKVFIVDDRVAITGGRNYRADYFDRGTRKNFKDRDCLVIGPVVQEMTDSFMDYWTFKWSVANDDAADTGQESVNNAGDAESQDMFAEVDSRAANPHWIKKTFTDKAFLVDRVKFIADAPGKAKISTVAPRRKRTPSVAGRLSEFIAGAQKTIIIQTPYLILPKKGEKIFAGIRRKKPDIDMIISTNSLSSTDNFMSYARSCQGKKKYLKKMKWRIFEFKYRPADHDLFVVPVNPQEREKNYFTCLHGKSCVVDNQQVFIGSFNLDPRSISLNTEAGLIIYDERVARDVADDILRDIAPQNSWTIGRQKKMPVIAHFSGVLEDILRIVPIVDVWPFSYATSFELLPGKQPLPFNHQEFYKHYKAVGDFPDMEGSPKSIRARLFKALFGKVTEPLL